MRTVLANAGAAFGRAAGCGRRNQGERAMLFFAGSTVNQSLGSADQPLAQDMFQGQDFTLWDLVPFVATGKAAWNLIKCYTAK